MLILLPVVVPEVEDADGDQDQAPHHQHRPGDGELRDTARHERNRQQETGATDATTEGTYAIIYVIYSLLRCSPLRINRMSVPLTPNSLATNAVCPTVALIRRI